MKFSCIGHPRTRMKERRISDGQISYVLENFHTTYPGNLDSTTLLGTLPDGRTLKVWVIGSLPLVEPVIIKSAAWEGVDDD